MRAIGTAFTVHIRKIDVEVIVTEGTVELDRRTTAQLSQHSHATTATAPTQPKPTVKASAGSMLTFDKNLLNDVKLMVASQLEKHLAGATACWYLKASHCRA